MWPFLLDMTKEESMQHLRCLEINAFSGLVSALRAQGSLDNEKLKLIKDTGAILHISQERHKAEIRRVVNDEKLNTIAYHVNGEKHSVEEWVEEGQRLIPLLARVAPQTAYAAIADEVADSASKLNKTLPSPASTERKRPSSISPTHSNASTSDLCSKNVPFRISEPEIKKRKLSLSMENCNISQHLMGPPKISKIQQIYRQKTKAKQKEQQLIKVKSESEKPEYIQLQQINVAAKPSPNNQQPSQSPSSQQPNQPQSQSQQLQAQSPTTQQQPPQLSPKVQSTSSSTTSKIISAANPKVNILQNVSIQSSNDESSPNSKNDLLTTTTTAQSDNSNQVDSTTTLQSSSVTLANDGGNPPKLINKLLTNKINQLTVKTSSGQTNDVQKTIKVCATRKTLSSKTVTTSSGQKLIVVSTPQTLTSPSILQRTLTTIPFKNISVKNLDKLKIVTSTTNSLQQTVPLHLTNAKQKVVTVRTSANKKMIPISQVQVLNTKGGIKVLPLDGKIISKANSNATANSVSVHFVNDVKNVKSAPQVQPPPPPLPPTSTTSALQIISNNKTQQQQDNLITNSGVNVVVPATTTTTTTTNSVENRSSHHHHDGGSSNITCNNDNNSVDAMSNRQQCNNNGKETASLSESNVEFLVSSSVHVPDSDSGVVLNETTPQTPPVSSDGQSPSPSPPILQVKEEPVVMEMVEEKMVVGGGEADFTEREIKTEVVDSVADTTKTTANGGEVACAEVTVDGGDHPIKVEEETNSYYIIDGEQVSEDILVDGIEMQQPLEVLNIVGSLDPITGQYSAPVPPASTTTVSSSSGSSEQNDVLSLVESHHNTIKTEMPESDLNV